MIDTNKVGKHYRCNKSFRSDDSVFIKGIEYKLEEIIEEEIFTLYIFNEGKLYGDYSNGIGFEKYFTTRGNYRVRTINKVLYED